MKSISKIKLNNLDAKELKKIELSSIRGGSDDSRCRCGCVCVCLPDSGVPDDTYTDSNWIVNSVDETYHYIW